MFETRHLKVVVANKQIRVIIVMIPNKGEDTLRVKIIVLTIFGFFFLTLGAIGVFLPLWPTTPFVLLAVACFSSAPRIKKQIMKLSFFKEHIENYEQRNGLSQKTIMISLVWLWGMLLISAVLIQVFWLWFVLFLVGIAVTTHIVWMARAKERNEE